MSYKLQNLTQIGNNGKAGVVPALWMYWNEDDETVTTAGYFAPNSGIKLRDQIMVISADNGSIAWYHASVNESTGVITLFANS